MIEYYNAFISYKHAPVDNKVAAHIQSALEHFHIPGKIRKKTGKKQIQRVFLDKDELPITSDLSDTISHALENSDFLIVICSTSTCKSEWVKKEIQYFLRNHTHDQILTVLAEGEPEEVIPEELLSEERLLPNADGSASYVKVPIEPLSCDYRMPFRQADKEELPRLAAALIGCSYDELMNRRRQYQMRRIGILAATLTVLALGFSFYMVNTANKIDKNYKASLKNQSLYLANESQKLLKEERRIEAIQLALEALPNDKKDRPVTAEAIKALTDATLAYQPIVGNGIYAVWNYHMASTITKMMISPEGTCFATMDDAGNVSVWNVETHESLLDFRISDSRIRGGDFIDEESFVVWGGKEVYALELGTQDVIWKLEFDDYFSIDSFSFSADRKYLFLPSHGGELLKISIDDGKIAERWDIEKYYDGSLLTYSKALLSPDENNMLFAFETLDLSYVAVLNLETGEWRDIPFDDNIIMDVIWTDAGHFVVASFERKNAIAYSYGDTKIVQDNYVQIACHAVSDLNQVWSSETKYNDIRLRSRFYLMPYVEQLAFYCANDLVVFQTSDGKVVRSYDVPSSLVDVSDRDQDGRPIAISTDGDLISTADSIGDSALTLTSEFTDELDMALVYDGVYVHKKFTNEVIYYDTFVCDEDWEEIDELPAAPTSNKIIKDEYLVIEVANQDAIELLGFDLSSNDYIWHTQIKDMSSTCKFLGVYEEILYLTTADKSGKLYLISVDIEDGSIIEKEHYSSAIVPLQDTASFSDGQVVYMYSKSSSNDGAIRLRNLDTEEEREFDFLDRYIPEFAPVYFPQADLIYYSDKYEGDFIIDVNEEYAQPVEFPSSWMGTKLVNMDPSGEFFLVSDEKKLMVLDLDGEEILEVSHLDVQPVGACVYSVGKNKKELLVTYGDGALCRYNLRTGNLLGKMQLSLYDADSVGAVEYQFHVAQSTLYLQQYHTTHVIDLNSWVEVASVTNCLGYCASSDEFPSYSIASAKNIKMGFFRHYTLDELIEKGKRITQNTELTPEQRSEYGI